MSTKISNIILAKGIFMDMDYKNVLSYHEGEMLTLCQSNTHKVAERNHYSFIKESSNIISTDFTYDECVEANYIAFQNYQYNDKWFFAWITKVEYINDGTTRLHFRVDIWSTWVDYWETRPCFVKREHMNDDTIGVNTTPEDLDVGMVECLTQYNEDLSVSRVGYWVCIECDYDLETNSQFEGISVYNNMICGHSRYYIAILNGNENDGYLALLLFIYAVNQAGHIADLKNMYCVPFDAIATADREPHTVQVTYPSTAGSVFNLTYYTTTGSFSNRSKNLVYNKPLSWGDFTPRNNKCFCYPYNYLLVTNNTGNQDVFRYEDFNGSDTSKFEFLVEACMGVGYNARVVPVDYKHQSVDYDEQIPLGKYPVCGWSADAYTNWLFQNAVNIATKVVGVVGTTAMSVASMGASVGQVAEVGGQIQSLGNTASLSEGIIGLVNDFRTASLLPNIEGNGQNAGDINFSAKTNMFSFKLMRARLEYMWQIDDYFTKFGYRINRLTNPLLVGRRNWNYIEIGEGEIIGVPKVGTHTMPSTAMDLINNICRRGTTVWHNHDAIGNYGLQNDILT